MKRIECCKNCKWGFERPGRRAVLAECRRYAPRRLQIAEVDGDGNHHAYAMDGWPEVSPADFCGEFALSDRVPEHVLQFEKEHLANHQMELQQ